VFVKLLAPAPRETPTPKRSGHSSLERDRKQDRCSPRFISYCC